MGFGEGFTRKGYGRIYVMDASQIELVKGIIKKMDEFEYGYLPDKLIAPFSEYPRLEYTHKFDSLSLNDLTAICLSKGIVIFCLDNGRGEYIENAPKKFKELEKTKI